MKPESDLARLLLSCESDGSAHPIIENSSAQVRHDKTFTYVHFSCDASGTIVPEYLKRWNDNAGRAEDLVLVNQGD